MDADQKSKQETSASCPWMRDLRRFRKNKISLILPVMWPCVRRHTVKKNKRDISSTFLVLIKEERHEKHVPGLLIWSDVEIINLRRMTVWPCVYTQVQTEEQELWHDALHLEIQNASKSTTLPTTLSVALFVCMGPWLRKKERDLLATLFFNFEEKLVIKRHILHKNIHGHVCVSIGAQCRRREFGMKFLLGHFEELSANDFAGTFQIITLHD